MSWIKRNLYFVVGGVVAVALLALAGYYFYSKWSLNTANLEKLEQAYSEWERIINSTPNPGNNKVDNVKLAREQRKEVREVIDKVKKYFAPIPPVPNPANGIVTKEDFASSLRRTTDQLRKEAAVGGVSLPPNYDFSFQAERNLPNFAPGSLPQLAAQLGDIKVITSILFKAKVNSLDAVRRERVSSDDMNGPQSDYLETGHVSVTNDLAVLVPYEVTFDCFSAELATVLASLGNAGHGIIVKAVNVEPSGMNFDPNAAGDRAMGAVPPAYYNNPEYRRMYRPGVQPQPAPVRGGLQTMLDEESLKITLVLDVVRLLPKK